MFQRIVTLTVAAALALTMASAVQANEFKGKVVRLDPAAKVVIFDDGKMYRMVPNTVVIVEEKPVTFETLRPGASVVIRSGEVVEFKDGKYIVITPSASPR
jgi:methyl coenzyme M reductase subunit C